MLYNLIDVRKDESKIKELNFYCNALIIFLLSLTAYSFVYTLNPVNLNKNKARVNWLTIGLISSLISGGIAYKKLPEIEKKVAEIEDDSKVFEQNNRQLALSFANEYNQQQYLSLLNPPQPQQQNPLMNSLMEQIMSIPIVGENASESQETSSQTNFNPSQNQVKAITLNDQNYEETGTNFVKTNYAQSIPVQSEVEFLIPQKQELKATGASILDEASATSLSTIFSSPPGTGKTVTLLDWMRRLFVKFPDAYVTVVAQKNDSFLGLNSIGAVSVFNGIDLTIAENAINELFEILNMRKSCDEITRQQFKTQPCWLILDDWFSIYDVISKNKKLWSDLSAKLSTIVTVGREFNVAIAVTTHSFNIASLGLAKDSNIRSCLNIMSLGFISKDEYGRNQGGFDAINGILNNNSIISMEYREPLKQELERLIVDSNNNQTPVIFTTMGHPPRMALLPNLINIKSYKIPPHILQSLQNKIGKIRGKSLQIETEDDDSIYNEIEIQDKKNQVYELIEKGITSKMDIIKQVWGASTGRKYQQACQEYNQIMEG